MGDGSSFSSDQPKVQVLQSLQVPRRSRPLDSVGLHPVQQQPEKEVSPGKRLLPSPDHLYLLPTSPWHRPVVPKSSHQGNATRLARLLSVPLPPHESIKPE